MKQVFLRAMKSLAIIATLAIGCVAVANETAKNVVKVDASKGDAFYTNGDATRNIPACVSCHGAAGNSTITQNPKLSGQHAAYLHKQLVLFANGVRNNPVMSPYAKAMTDEEMRNVAEFLSVQAPKPGAARNKETIDLGKKVFRAGIASKNVPACAGCHGPGGAGIPSQYPRIAGQHQDYTVAQLIAFRTGGRANNAAMVAIAQRMSDDEMKAVADYIAGLK
jgi:cytochrome c553